MELLPAIDLRQGRVVRLVRGNDAKRTEYSDRPADVLARYLTAGVRRVHAVDLDAAFGEPPQTELIATLARELSRARPPGRRGGLQLGGGLRSEKAVTWALEEAGCERVVIGSMVARDLKTFTRLACRYPERLVPALDVEGGEVRVSGWRAAAARSLEAICHDLRNLPCPAVLVTDVSRDGTLDGPNLELARRVAQESGIPALLSGGVSSLDDLAEARETPGIAGVVVGKALYEGLFNIREALAACRGVEGS
jgi:phosphoribosylformimino-5-aminoimidazole carboxamide ribotide isomerase